MFLAGANGAGKTTVASNYVASRFPYWPQANADQLLLALQQRGPVSQVPTDALSAAKLVDQAVLCLSLLGEPLIVETVFSSTKYQGVVPHARRANLIFRLVYIATEHPDINVARVRQRVADGGHDVPEDRTRARWRRSLDNLPWFVQRADRLVVFDNSGEELRVLALRHLDSPLEIRDTRHPACLRLLALAGARTLPAAG